MDLGYSAIVFLIIALIWAILVFISFKRITGVKPKGDRKMLFSGFILFIGIGAIFIGAAGAFEYMDSPEFCGKICHVMEPNYRTYSLPGNNSYIESHADAGVTCSSCHDGPGIGGKIGGLAAGTAETYIYVTGTYDTDDLGGYGGDENCLKCHDGAVTVGDRTAMIPKNVTTVQDVSVDPHTDDASCTDCHTFHTGGIGLTQDACAVCHGTEIDNFMEKLTDHGERTEKDCMDCHDRAHPEDAYISFQNDTEVSEAIDPAFCSDCHQEEYTAFTSGVTSGSQAIYGAEGCLSCHSEHEAVEPPHSEISEDCAVCHGDYPDVTIHDRSNISFLNVTENATDIGIDIDEEFCSSCHNEVFDRLETGVHSQRDCLECHTDHEIRVDFENCASCHTDIPAFHDVEQKDCTKCHDTTVIHTPANGTSRSGSGTVGDGAGADGGANAEKYGGNSETDDADILEARTGLPLGWALFASFILLVLLLIPLFRYRKRDGGNDGRDGSRTSPSPSPSSSPSSTFTSSLSPSPGREKGGDER